MKSTRKGLTLQQIAVMAKTTKSTVSRVLSKDSRISGATRERVQALLARYDYRPNFLARSLARGRTGIVGVLTSNISSGFFAEVIRGIDIAAGKNSGHLLISIAHGSDDYHRLFHELCTTGQVDGLVLIDPPLSLFGVSLPNDHLPLVLTASRAPRQARTWCRVDSVTVDNASVMHRIIEHLLEQGATEIVHLAGHRSIFDAVQRRRAFEKVVRQLRVPTWRCMGGHLIERDGVETLRREFGGDGLLPSAFVAFNDSVAFGVQEALRGRESIAVTGWDNSPGAVFRDVTSVEMPLTGLGEMSARLLADRLEGRVARGAGARLAMLDVVLHQRDSSRIHANTSAKRV